MASRWRNRVTALEYHKPGDLAEHPAQWRIHPDKQRAALGAVLDEVGMAGALLAYRGADGRLTVVDGHLRRSLDPDAEWPVLVLDIDDDEALKLLATHDPLAAMAATDWERLGDLLEKVETESDGLAGLLDGLRGQAEALHYMEEEFPLLEEDVVPKPKTVKCPECGHEFEV